MIPVSLFGGRSGSKKIIGATDEGELIASIVPYPPIQQQKTHPFRQYFTDDGTSSGSNDMGVDGSTTNVDFFIPASAIADRYITNINVLVGYGTSGQPNQWADGTALTNGTRIFYEASGVGEVDIHDGIKTNQDLFRLNHNGIQTSWEVRHVNATNDYGYFMPIDMEQYVMPLGVKLDKGSTQRIVFCIRDNAGTDADTFDAIAYGFDRFE
mgnify:CR=1 FL=1